MTVPLVFGVYVGGAELGWPVGEDVSVSVADSDAGLVGTPVELGVGIVEAAASEVREVTPYRAAQSVRLRPLGQHHVPSALSVQ